VKYVLNNQLDGIRLNILKIINQLTISDKPFNLQTIKSMLDGNDQRQVTLMYLMSEHHSEMKKLLGKDFEKAPIVKYI